VIRRAPKTGTLFVLEEVPFECRRRWYCDLDGADPPSFDDLDEAAVWGLDRAAGVVVRTLQLEFYLAGEHPPDWGHDLDLRPWPPSESDRLRIEAAYVAAVAHDAQDEIDQRAYEAARSAWLTENAPHLGAAAPAHECALQVGESDDVLAFEELSPEGELCGCRAQGPGRWAFGSPAGAIAEALASTRTIPGWSPSWRRSTTTAPGATGAASACWRHVPVERRCSTSARRTGAPSCSTAWTGGAWALAKDGACQGQGHLRLSAAPIPRRTRLLRALPMLLSSYSKASAGP